MAYKRFCFKPCYKWNTFNTICMIYTKQFLKVLNLVISGIPSILFYKGGNMKYDEVLNLVISGIPSILRQGIKTFFYISKF